MAGDRTEQATPRRRQKARERGQIARSRELMASAAVMAVILILATEAGSFPFRWQALLQRSLDWSVSRNFDDDRASTLAMIDLLLVAERDALWFVGTAVGMGFLAASLAAVIQGGLVFSPSALQPSLARFSPVEHAQQMFSLTSAARMLKSLLPGSAIAWLAWSMLARDWRSFAGCLYLRPMGTTAFIFARVFEIAWKATLVLLAWSAADYLIERQKVSSDLRMSRQELRDEYKETEGNPAIKGRIRRLRRQVHRRQMLAAVKRAAVVVTNPDEFAVALEYRPLMNAPVVVAKGRNLFARQIKDLARWHGIVLVENRPLAHALYRAVEVGQSIPPKLYAVVAAVLAAVYRAQERATQHAHAPRPTSGVQTRKGG